MTVILLDLVLQVCLFYFMSQLVVLLPQLPGGFDGSSRLDTVEAYDPIANTWHTVAPMGTPRSHLASATLNGVVYAIGGWDAAALNTVEAYDPIANAWHTVASMGTPRGGPASATCC